MAQRHYTIKLDNANTPLMAKNKSRTVLHSYTPDKELPDVYYMENVMPTQYGFRSVGYSNIVSAILPAVVNLEDVRTIYAVDGARVHLLWDTRGNAYSLRAGKTVWRQVTGVPVVSADFSTNDISTGNVAGVSYIFYKQLGCYTYDSHTSSLVAVTLAGLSDSIHTVLGITSSHGYLIALTKSSVLHSSLLSATDFVPSTISGAGGASISDIDGLIQFAVSNASGYLIYSKANVVAAVYTGNKQYPFKFQEIPSSGGGLSLDLIAYEANAPSQFSFTSVGLQTLDPKAATVILPEVTDFLASKLLEDFDSDTREFIYTAVTSMRKKVKLIASRYLVISYGHTEFTHALVYDISLQRMGKLKITHADVFEFISEQAELAKESMCFLLPSGAVVHADLSEDATNANGVIILGKIQASKGKVSSLYKVDIESCKSGTLYDLASIDGKLTSSIVAGSLLSATTSDLQIWGFSVQAKSHSLALIGDFDLNTFQLTYGIAGSR